MTIVACLGVPIRYIVEDGEQSAHLAGLGDAELYVQGKGLPPVFTGQASSAEPVMDVAEADMRASQLEAVTDLCRVLVSLDMDGKGSTEITGKTAGLAETVERLCLTRGIANVMKQSEGLPVVGDRLLVVAGLLVHDSEVGEHTSVTCRVAELAVEHESLPVVIGRLLVATDVLVHHAEIG